MTRSRPSRLLTTAHALTPLAGAVWLADCLTGLAEIAWRAVQTSQRAPPSPTLPVLSSPHGRPSRRPIPGGTAYEEGKLSSEVRWTRTRLIRLAGEHPGGSGSWASSSGVAGSSGAGRPGHAASIGDVQEGCIDVAKMSWRRRKKRHLFRPSQRLLDSQQWDRQKSAITDNLPRSPIHLACLDASPDPLRRHVEPFS